MYGLHDTGSWYNPPQVAEGFARLPYEIQLKIIRAAFEININDYLISELSVGCMLRGSIEGRENLKEIRCMSRVFCDAVTPSLFASMHLSASPASIERARNLTKSHLSRHVRELVFHGSTFKGCSRDKDSFLEKLNSSQGCLYRYESCGVPDEYVHGLYQNYLELVDDAEAFQGWRREELQQITNRCPNLAVFAIIGHSGSVKSYALNSHFVYRQTGLKSSSEESEMYEGVVSFVEAFSYFPTTRLNLDFYPAGLVVEDAWAHLDERPVLNLHRALGKQFEQLEYLASPLKLMDHSGQSLNQEHISRDQVLWHYLSSHVQHLSVRSDGHRTRDNVVIKPYIAFPQLKKLTFGSNSHKSTNIIRLTELVSKSLIHLEFQCRSIDGSLIDILWQISKCTTLETCTAAETVSDKKSQFNVRRSQPPHYPSKAVLMEKMVEALLRKREWPWWFAADKDEVVYSKWLPPNKQSERWRALTSDPWASTVDVFEGY